jgi:magnesium chelatase family protein
MTPRLLKKHYELDADSLAMLENVMTEHGFSARANNHILKVAHTIADLDAF